ncbi:MAG: GNAT family N-acetyltransferase [Archangiaceae bacterium]|nr:GNAT family N-acetyltransferase [Archangiaceae bacterium]
MELRLATESEKVDRDRVTFAEWGTRLTLEQYLEREQVLRAHPFSRGMRTWLLTEGSTVLASCETFDNASRLGSARGTSWSIASVYTEAHSRGRGYGTQLMDRVAAAADREGLQGVVLFSDVGERMYQRSGYASAPGDDWVLTPTAVPLHPVEGSASPIVPELEAPPAGTLQLEPTAAQLDWALAREALYARFLSRTRPQSHAARAGAAHASWAAYFKSNELIVLWLQPGSADETAQVLDAARAEAHRCGLERVRLWALPGAVTPVAATQEKRKDELPMFRSQATAWRHVQRALWV